MIKMWRISILDILVLSTLCFGSNCLAYSFTKNGKIAYYVSSSEGSDNNDGLSPDSPKRFIRSIKKKDSVVICLKRGDVFFEKMTGYKNSIITSYGHGNKPVICGFKVLINPDFWIRVSEDVWKLDLSAEDNFAGHLSDNASHKKTFNDVGLIYDPSEDRVFGHLVQRYSQLKKDGDFYMTELFKPSDIEKDPFRYLYWKSKQDPRTKSKLCFSMYENGISKLSGCIVKGVAVVGFSRHGICNATNTLIEDCQIDLIGGSNFVRTKSWCRYGNGIEFWAINENDNTVRNCVISRTFDCGVTIQCNAKEIKDVHNIHFVNNKFYHCRQAFEHFISPSTSSYSPQYVDCDFSKNVCYEMGINEFDSPEERDAAILSYENRERFISVESNIFYGSSYYCGSTVPLGMNNNKVYIYKGQYLNHYHKDIKYSTIIADGDESLYKYREWSGDNSEIVIIERGSRLDQKLKKKISKRIGFKKPELHLERLNR